MGSFAAVLDERFRQAVAAERAQSACVYPPRSARLPRAVQRTLVVAAELDAQLGDKLGAYYADKLPRLRVDQLERANDDAAALLRRPLDPQRVPRFVQALRGMYAALTAEDLDPAQLTGASTPESLLASRPDAISLYEPTLHGLGLPMLGAYPAERALCSAELLSGRDPDEVFDIRIGGNLNHELCHGPDPAVLGKPQSWMALESAAIHLGYVARPAHIFPEEPGEAVPGVACFVMIGEALARHFGRKQLWRLSFGATAEACFGDNVAAALEVASWQELLRRGAAPFVQDALRAESWLKLIDAARGSELLISPPVRGPLLLDEADRRAWSELPWWSEPVTERDREFLRCAVRALFHVNVLAPSFQSHPAEIPDGRIVIDVARCQLQVAPRPHGVYGEPMRWTFPPSLSRQLHQRGAHHVIVEGARRRDHAAIAQALFEVATEHGALPAEKVMRWTSSA